MLPLGCSSGICPTADVVGERRVDDILVGDISLLCRVVFLSNESFQGHQRILAIECMTAAFPSVIPETSVVIVVHHTVISISVSSISTFFRLPVVESCHIVEVVQRADKVFDKAGLSSGRIGPCATGIVFRGFNGTGCGMLVASFYNLYFLAGKVGL